MSYVKPIRIAPAALSQPRARPQLDRQPSFSLGLGSAALSTGLEALVGVAVLSGVSLVLCTIAAAAFL